MSNVHEVPELKPKDRYMLRPEEAAALLNCGRTKVFLLIKSGELEYVPIGGERTRRVPLASVEDYCKRARALATDTDEVPA